MDHTTHHKLFIDLNTSFIPNMLTKPRIYVNNTLSEVLFNELQTKENSALKQLAYISTLPGIKAIYGLPDIHAGYGFPIGSVSGFDVNEGIVSPGGVGFDINCGVRSVATNLEIKDLEDKKAELAELLFQAIPTGMGSESGIKHTAISNINLKSLNRILDSGLNELVLNKLVDEKDLDKVENNGFMKGNSRLVCQKAKGRGLNQIASLGSGNHYLEIQYVDKIYHKESAELMNIYREGQILITIHTGSRGLGHAVCEDFINQIKKRDSVFNDDLAYVSVNSELGMNYFDAMSSAANFAFCNRAMISKISQDVFSGIFRDFKGDLIYDVCHNIAKRENHIFDGERVELMVHRKGASRAFGPGCEGVPDKYTNIGQPVLVGGSMGTSSYILTGTEYAMKNSLGSACHGAGRLLSRSVSSKTYTPEDVLEDLRSKGVELRCKSLKGIVEEAPGCYKDVDVVADYCEEVGISNKVCRVKPYIVIKG